MNRAFLKAGHPPTLLASFLYFDLSFMIWVLLGPLGISISKDLHLDPAQKGLLVGTPVLAGAFLRVVCGTLVDRFGPRKVAIACQLIVIAGLAITWLAAPHSLAPLFGLALVLGLAGASFAIALPMASAWYPPQYQGTALGIAGAGNSGTALAALFAPALAMKYGWINVIGLATIPMVLVLILFVAIAKEAPSRRPAQSLAAFLPLLGKLDCWRLMLFYMVTFGGFVGLASFLTIYFNDQYGLSPKTAGFCTAAVVFAGSFIRPFGGALADRIGGLRALTLVYICAAAIFAFISIGLPTIQLAFAAFVIGMLFLGMGNGAVFQLVPTRFPGQVGAMTGLVGMAGGIGGFYLPTSLGLVRKYVGSYNDGFLAYAAFAVVALLVVLICRRSWKTTQAAAPADAVAQAA